MTGAEIVAQVLVDEGCDVAFGYSGGAILPVYDAIFRYNRAHPRADGGEVLQLVVPANEQGAGFMASGYARASGRVGVVIVTSGPGATNLVTPIRDAAADSVPLVAICGQVPTTAIGSDAFQEAPVTNVMGACAKHVFLVTDPARLEATLRTAFEIARSGRPGPVVVDIPKNVQNTALQFAGAGHLPIPGYRARLEAVNAARLDDAACARFFAALDAARRPLIYAGGGVIAAGAATELAWFSAAFGLPVTTTLMGLGAYDTTQPLALHLLGMHGTAYANYAVEDCDFVMALGARFDDRVAAVPAAFAPKAKFIAHIDIDPAEIGKVKPVDWHHVGQLAPALAKLTAYGRRHGSRPDLSAWHAHIAELKRVHAMNYDRTRQRIQPQAVIEAINHLTQGRAVISTGVGQHQMWAAQYFDFRAPRHWLTSGSMGTMGFGLPAAIGAQFARPDALVIDIDGDGSIRMNQGELETVTTYGLPLKIVLLNNGCDGMVHQWQKLFYKNRYAATDKSLRKKDFVLAAKADGFGWVERVEQPETLAATLEAFLAHAGPAFLEVMVDPDADVYPMVPAGKPYTDMLTGDWIPARGAVSPTATHAPRPIV
ncbi:MAG TPA: biosynthetic-type acetolactate synthase large subunit [Rhodanobacteraceae bacterium]|nr:biosynthetic-type acetolactate synthase large subunit [Rhodanobacteraceae bacterium]